MSKLILLLKRRPDLSVESFQVRWRDHHGPIATRLPGLRRHVQSHALPQGYSKRELLFDGIAEFWFDDAAALDAAVRSTAWTAMEADGADLFDHGRTVRMPVDVHVIKNLTPPVNAVKNIEFVNRRPGMDLEPFRAYWRERHGPLAATIPVLVRYEQNHLAMRAYAAGAKPAYDGLAITWFASTADMKRGTLTEEYRLTREDETRFLPDGHLPIIITREHVIM